MPQNKKADSSQDRFTVAEFFCGCGGFSKGFELTGRFDVVFGNDIKSAALHAFRQNHVSSRGEPLTINEDIRVLAEETHASHQPRVSIALKRMGVADRELDCLIGGSPCQGFSQMRRGSKTNEQGEMRFKGYDRQDEDPRNMLALSFLDIAAHLLPKVVVIENVPQMLRHGVNGELGGLERAIRRRLEALGYYVTIAVKVNAADYGVPQLRNRAFVIASRIGPIEFPKPTHADPRLRVFGEERLDWVTVEQAISDLPPPVPGKLDLLGGGSLESYLPNPSDYAQKLRSLGAFPFNHVTRSYCQRVLDLISQMRPDETWNQAMARLQKDYQGLILASLESGETVENTIDRLHTEGLLNKTFFKKYYWSAYTRLAWHKPALTITANANFLGSGRFTHPTLQRGITMREAARLQSFPDDFKFITSPIDASRTTDISVGIDMIGEAVPPLLAHQLAQTILQHLAKRRSIPVTDNEEPQVLETANPIG